MTMRQTALVVFVLAFVSGSASGQSSLSACGPKPDSAARQVIKVFTGIRVCLLASQLTSQEEFPRDWAAKARTLILETQRDGDNRRAAISGTNLTWTINGRPAAQDSLAESWQKAVVDYLDAAFQADELRRENARLQAEIDSLPLRIAAAKVRIAYLESRDRELNFAIMEAGKRENAERAQVARLQAALAAAESRASSARAQAGSARDERTRQSLEAQARAAEQQANDLREAVYAGERSSNTGASSRTVADAQEELRALQPGKNIALLKLQLANYESTKVEDLEQQIRQLDAPRLLPVLDAQAERARQALVAVLEARGKSPSR